MKLRFQQFEHRPTQAANRGQRQGSTLIEIMFASTILVMLIIALMAAHLVGLREDQWVESKAGASDSSRKILNQLPVDIRSSKMWFIGNLSGTNFTAATNTAQASALELFQTTNGSTPAIFYYFDLSNSNNNDGHLVRVVNTNWNPVVISSNLVNWLGNGFTFNVEDYTGNFATNSAGSKNYKQIIHVILQYCMFQYPLTVVGTNGLYDFYKIEFRATPHLPE